MICHLSTMFMYKVMENRSVGGVVNSCREAPVKLSRLKGKVYCMNLK